LTDFFEKLNKAKHKIRMKPEAKNTMRGRLYDFMEANPVRESLFAHFKAPRLRGLFFGMLHLRAYKPAPLFAVITIFVLAGGGLSYAAEGALPGEALYPVKVRINEEVRAVLALSQDSKADWEAARVERRLEEAAKLSLRGEVSEKAKTELAERFEKNSGLVEKRIAMLESAGEEKTAVDIASRLEVSLRAHGQVLSQIGTEEEHDEEKGGAEGETASSTASGSLAVSAGSGPESNRGLLSRELSHELQSIIRTRLSLESRIEKNDGKPETKEAAEGKLKAAEHIIAAVRAYLESKGSGVDASTTARIEARIADAERLNEEAAEKLERGLYGEAFTTSNKIFRIVQELRVFFEAQDRISVMVKFRGNAFVEDDYHGVDAEAGGEEDNENDEIGEDGLPQARSEDEPGEDDEHGNSGKDGEGEQKSNDSGIQATTTFEFQDVL